MIFPFQHKPFYDSLPFKNPIITSTVAVTRGNFYSLMIKPQSWRHIILYSFECIPAPSYYSCQQGKRGLKMQGKATCHHLEKESSSFIPHLDLHGKEKLNQNYPKAAELLQQGQGVLCTSLACGLCIYINESKKCK